MKSLIAIAVFSLSGCAYTARDIYRDSHEIRLRNASETAAEVHVTYSGKETVTNVAAGEWRKVFYEDFVPRGQGYATLMVARPDQPDVKIDVPLVFQNPSFLKLWNIHYVTLSSSGELSPER